MEVNLAVLPGDGAGPAVATRALNVLQAVGERFGHSSNFKEGLIEGVALDTLGKAPSYETLCVIVEYAKAELERPMMSDTPRPHWRDE
jgi:isocitrate/isopropylmalate dehydrogenase